MNEITEDARRRAEAMFERKEPLQGQYLAPGFDMDAYLTEYGVPYRKEANGESIKYIVQCPFNEDHKGKDAAVIVQADGARGFHCFHDGCSDKHWQDFKKVISGSDDLSRFYGNGKKKPEQKRQDKDIDPWQFLVIGRELQARESKIEWAVQDILPKGGITTLNGRGGIGKTTLLLGMANAVSKGELFLGRLTLQMPVYFTDFENPEAIVIDRARNLNITDVYFWLQSFDFPPPRIDSDEYTLYKKLPPGLLIFDSLRASQMGDENSSKDMAFAMQRYKELRDYGHTIILIHHTMKANEQSFRGSMAILDLADHILSFFPVRQMGDETAVEGDDLDDMTFYLGTREKTRFAQVKLYLRRANGRFEIAGNPDDEKIERMRLILVSRGPLVQKDFIKLTKDELGYSKALTLRLLKKGESNIWEIKKGEKNSSLYQLSSYSPLYRGVKTGKQESGVFTGLSGSPIHNVSQVIGMSKFSSSPNAAKKTGKQAIKSDPRYLDGVAHFLAQGLSQDDAESRTLEVFEEQGWVQ